MYGFDPAGGVLRVAPDGVATRFGLGEVRWTGTQEDLRDQIAVVRAEIDEDRARLDDLVNGTRR